MTPAMVLGTLARLGGRIGRVYLVGCEPGVIDEGIGLSDAVAGAVDRAVDEVLEVLDLLALTTVGKEA
jgi:hydrogenase maturation protease